MQAVLSASIKEPVNLSEIFTELHYYNSPLTFAEFSQMLFRETPDYLKHIHRLYQETTNVQVSVNAQLAHLVYSLGTSFGGSKPDRKITPKDFLPFQLQGNSQGGIKAYHKKILEKLLKEQKLSMKLIPLVAPVIR